MSTPVNLPALGESVTEGTITRWLKQVGDTVEVDEPLLEVSTDKVDTEIPSPVAGTLLEIKAEEDETVEVGAELSVIGDEGEGGGSDDSASDEAEDVLGRRVLRRGRGGRGRLDDDVRGGRVRRGRGRARTTRSRWPTRRRSRSRPAQEERWRRRYAGHPARPGRVGHRGHHHPLAEVGRRRGRGRRAAARGLHRQGRHRDPLAGGRHAAGDQGRGGRDRRGRRRAGDHRRRLRLLR